MKSRPRARKVTLPRGLVRRAAFRLAVKRYGGDFRGFTYNPRTGRATLT